MDDYLNTFREMISLRGLTDHTIKWHFGASYDQSKRAFQLATAPNFPADKFITHVLPLDKINEGIQLTRSGEAVKVVLHPWD